MRDLDEREGDGSGEEVRAARQRWRRGLEEEDCAGQERVRSTERPQERRDTPPGAHEVSGKDEGREGPGQDIVDEPVDDERRRQPLPASRRRTERCEPEGVRRAQAARDEAREADGEPQKEAAEGDRKSTRLNSSHRTISYAVFCLKKNTHEILSASFFSYIIFFRRIVYRFIFFFLRNYRMLVFLKYDLSLLLRISYNPSITTAIFS